MVLTRNHAHDSTCHLRHLVEFVDFGSVFGVPDLTGGVDACRVRVSTGCAIEVPHQMSSEVEGLGRGEACLSTCMYARRSTLAVCSCMSSPPDQDALRIPLHCKRNITPRGTQDGNLT